MKKIFKNQSDGITLIALVVTIVVLLILASIGIKTLTGDGGIINQAKEGKDASEISEEKEVIDISVVQAMDEDIMGNLETDILKKKLNNNTGEGKTEVIGGSETIVVKFVEKNRYYEIDKQGNTEGPKKLIKDENAGDLTKGGSLDGSEEKPYEINCIEDLVTFSIMVNGGNTELGLSKNQFSGKTVILTRTLDFQSIFSYNDYTTTKYGDLNTDGIVEDIRTELTKTDEGCIGFTPIGVSSSICFKGIFDGKENKIRNIYQNIQSNSGLFGGLVNATIKNVTISGKLISNTYYAGGISGYASNTNIINCINEAHVIEMGKSSTHNPAGGGIIAFGDEVTIINCINTGDVSSYSSTGGIAGLLWGKIINCYNSGNIIGLKGYNYGSTGGIVGNASEYGLQISNCFNIGNITSKDIEDTSVYVRAAGILGNATKVGSNTTISNVYNVGKIYGEKGYGAIVGGNWYSSTNICTVNNAYFLETPGLTGYYTSDGSIINPEQIISKDESFMYSNQLAEKLNEYIENTEETTEWKHWKIVENGYVTFE